MFGAIFRLGATLCALFNEREQIKNQKNSFIFKSWEPLVANRTMKMFFTNCLKYSGKAQGPHAMSFQHTSIKKQRAPVVRW